MSFLRKYLRNEEGQFAIMFAVCSTAILVGMLVAYDFSRMTSTRAKAAAVSDAAALAGASAFDRADRMEIVQAFIDRNASELEPARMVGEPVITFNDETGEVVVEIDTMVSLEFGEALGLSEKEVGARSVAEYPNTMDPLTIAFALDVSGSMGGLTIDGQVKLTALKDASTEMFKVIEGNLENKELVNKYIRTGMSAFNSGLAAEHEMSWGFVDVDEAINGLNFGGSTNTKVALENAHDQILRDRSYRQTIDPTLNLAHLDEFVIFMTDGANTAGDPIVLDEESYQSCLAMREDGIEIFAIAFTAPDQGQLLLMDCASWDDPAEDKDSKKAKNDRRRCGEGANLGNSSGNQSVNGQDRRRAALEKCRDEVLDDKKDHFYDAENAQSFKEIFRIIGGKINEASIRIKS